MSDDGKITPFRVVTNEPEEKNVPTNDYVIVDREGEEFYASGFMLFTSHHVAIMRDTGDGALPVLVMPLDRVHVAELVEDEIGDTANALPF